MSTEEVRVFKIPEFGLRVALESSMLKVRDFVEAIHVQLTNERRKLLVLKPSSENVTKTFIVKN